MGWNDKPPKESLIPGKNESSLPGRERRGTERLLPSPPEPVQLGGGGARRRLLPLEKAPQEEKGGQWGDSLQQQRGRAWWP